MGKLFFFDADGTLIPDDAQCRPSAAVCAALEATQGIFVYRPPHV